MSRGTEYRKYMSLAFMIVLSLGTQILGVVRSSVVAGVFGAGTELDAYNYANSILSFLFAMITAAVPTVIMPYYVQNKTRSDILDSFITIIYGLLFTCVAVLLCVRYPLVAIMSGKGNDFTDLVCTIMAILAIAQCFGSVNNLTVAFFQSQGKYNLPKIIQLISQLLVVGALMVSGRMTIFRYTWIVAAGIFLGFALDLTAAIRCGWCYIPTWNFKNPETIQLFRSFWPILLSTGVYQLSLMTDSVIAGRLEAGKVTILAYSSQISSIVNTVVIGNLKTYIYPRIIRNIKKKNAQRLFWMQSEALHCIVWLVISGFIIVGREGVSILFEHGSFTSEAADMVFLGAAIYIFGQQFNVIRDMIYKYFYAEGDTKQPAQNSILVSISNILISLLLWYFIGFYGVIFGTVCASCISMIIIFCRFKRKFGFDCNVWQIIIPYGKNMLCGFITILVMLRLKHCLILENQLMAICFLGCITVGVYTMLQRLLHKDVIEAFKVL